MKKSFALVMMLLLGIVGWEVGCAGGGEKPNNKLPCTADRNCGTTQACYQGYCTEKSDIPTPDGGNNAKPDETSTPTPDKPAPTPDTPAPTPDTPTQPTSYPPGPYGANVNDVAIDFTIGKCTGGPQVSLKDFYNHPKIKVLQITVHTVWCPSCRTQSQGLNAVYTKYAGNGLGIMYIMTENAQAGSGRISGQECTAYTSKYGFKFDALMDSGSVEMRKYFDRNAVPLNMIITTKDMKIRYKKSGALPERMNAIIESYL